MEDEVATAGFWASYENGLTRWLDRLQGHAPEGADPIAPAQTVLGGAWDGLLWFVGNILEAFYNLAFAVTHPGMWLSWVPHVRLGGPITDPAAAQSLMRFIYYGASVELFFVVLTLFVIVTTVGMFRTGVLWAVVRGFEGFANAVGRLAAWAGLVMVLQQIVIIFMQRVFAVSELSFGFGKVITFDISWWSEELKLYNAMVVTLCIAYTFVQGGHVRVDLIYGPLSYRAKRIIDMAGSLFFMIPAATLIWLYAWFFMWRHLVVPNPSASDTLDRLLGKARALRWNVETISFSPNGFNGYFLFKVLLVFFTLMLFVQAIAFFYRSYLELVEGPESEGRYLDRDDPEDPTAELVVNIH